MAISLALCLTLCSCTSRTDNREPTVESKPTTTRTEDRKPAVEGHSHPRSEAKDGESYRPELSSEYGRVLKIKAKMSYYKLNTKFQGPATITVTEVNGETLKSPVSLSWSRRNFSVIEYEDEQEVEDGAIFTALGYESLIMSGEPKGIWEFPEFDGEIRPANFGWGARKMFIGMKVLK